MRACVTLWFAVGGVAVAVEARPNFIHILMDE
jgi:hypothetical protein